MIKKTIITFIFLSILSVGISGQTTAPPESVTATAQRTKDRLTLQNEFIKIIVNNTETDTGRFAVETTGGDPKSNKDNNQSLIFGRPIPWTSFTSFKIGEDVVIFGGKSDKLSKRSGKTYVYGKVISQDIQNESIVTKYEYKNIEITQTLSLIRNPITRVKDTVKIHYVVTNIGKTPQPVSARIMLDTMLGTNDASPFRIGAQAIVAEKQFTEEELFDYWQTFDTLSGPSIVAQGTLNLPDAGIIPPDKLILANWGTLADNPWTFDYQENRSFVRAGEIEKDTALALYWNGSEVGANDSISFSTSYGLGGLSLAPGELSLGLTAPAEAIVAPDRDILLIGYVLNTGGFDSENTVVSFEIPQEFETTPEKTTFKLGTLESGESSQIPIKLKAIQGEEGIKIIKLKVTSDTLESNETTREIKLLAPPALQVQTMTTSFSPTDNYADVWVDITNPTPFQIRNLDVSLSPGQNGKLPSFEMPIKTIDVLGAQGTLKLHWKVKSEDISPLTLTLGVKAKSIKPITEKITVPSFRKSNGPKVILESRQTKLELGQYWTVRMKGKSIDALNGQLTFDPHYVHPIRLSYAPWITESKQESKIRIDKNTIHFDNLDCTTTSQNTVALIHFEVIGTGESQIGYTDSNQTQAKPLKFKVPIPTEATKGGQK